MPEITKKVDNPRTLAVSAIVPHPLVGDEHKSLLDRVGGVLAHLIGDSFLGRGIGSDIEILIRIQV